MSMEIPLLNSSESIEYRLSKNQLLRQNYDPSAYPPDLCFAREHGRAQAIGKNVHALQNVQRCRCCLKPIYSQNLPILCEPKQFLHIGASYPLYFFFVRQCIILCIVNVILITIPSTIINTTQGSMCKQLDGLTQNIYNAVCKSSVISIMNVKEIDYLQIEAIMNFFTIIINIVLIAYFEIQMQNQYKKISQGELNASDYSVMVKGLPKDITIYQIQKFLEDKLLYTGAPDVTIVKIYIIYNLKTYYSLYSNKRSLVQQLAYLQSLKNQYHQKVLQNTDYETKTKYKSKGQEILLQINQIQNKIELIDIQINNFQQSVKMLVEQLKNQSMLQGGLQGYTLSFSGKCIVTLNDTRSKDILVQNKKQNGLLIRLGYRISEFFTDKKGTLMISDAPQPADIIYSNMGSKKIARWKQGILATILIGFLMILDLILVTMTKKFLKQEKAINSQNLIFSFINSQIIAVSNSLLGRIIRTSQNSFAFHTTQTSYFHSVTGKLIFVFLINMLFTTFLSNVVSFYFIVQDKSTFQTFPLNFQSFLFDVFFLIVTNPFVSVFLIFFDHRQGYKLFKRFRIQKGYPVTQAEANLHYQNMQIDLSNKYSNIYRFVLFTSGIGAIWPPGFFVCLIALIMFYWLDKYLLLRRYVVPCKLGYSLTKKQQKFMQVFPVLFSVTSLIIMFIPIKDGKAFEQDQYSKGYYYLAWIGFSISLLIYLTTNEWIKKIIRSCMKEQQNNQNSQQKYKEIETCLKQDYSDQYPYFRIKRSTKSDTSSSQSSPRRQKLRQLKQQMGMNVFQVIKNYFQKQKYSPKV